MELPSILYFTISNAGKNAYLKRLTAAAWWITGLVVQSVDDHSLQAILAIIVLTRHVGQKRWFTIVAAADTMETSWILGDNRLC